MNVMFLTHDTVGEKTFAKENVLFQINKVNDSVNNMRCWPFTIVTTKVLCTTYTWF